MSKEKEIKVIDVPASFEKKIQNEEGETISILEAIAIIMNDLKEIKKGIL